MKNKNYIGMFVTSLIYAPLLTLWQRLDPVGFANNTWLTVVIGVGYTLLWLRPILTLRAWVRVCAAFFVTSIPIILRSLIQYAARNRALDQYNGKRREQS